MSGGFRLDLPLQFAHAVPGVEAGDLVGFGERRIVEGVLDEILDGALEVQHRLSDMQTSMELICQPARN